MTTKQPQDHFVIFMPSGRRGQISKGTTVLDAARQLGVEIESICGGRMTCNKCRVRLEEGEFQKHGIRSTAESLTLASNEEASFLQTLGSPEQRLACQACVTGDALLFVPEESRAHKQVIRKTAGERMIEVQPAVRQLYVEVDAATLGEHRGDWGRLQAALAEQWQLIDLTIDLPALRKLQPTLRKEGWKVTVTIWQEREVIDVQPGYQEGAYGLAVDIGSTTVAGFLCDLRTGEIVATESVMNPQVTYGEDLMSRVSYAMTNKNGTRKMHEAIIYALNRLAATAAREAGIQPNRIHEAVLAGNTTMTHILLDINPLELGGAPFALANRDAMDIKARELGLRLHPSANVHILPAEAGHVGADNVAVLLAEEPHKQQDLVLTVDVGTNAEIVLGNEQRLFSASSPTGPAFEGAQIQHGMRAALGAIERVRIDKASLEANFRVIGDERWSAEWVLGSDVPMAMQPNFLAAGICGSGIIEVVAEMFLAGILQPDGRFSTMHTDHPRIIWQGRKGSYVLATAQQSSTGQPIVVTQDDVRGIQLAKAALYAGAKLLMRQAEVTTVDRIVLAGAFGSYIDPKYAMILGLIPDCELEKVTAVGNAAGDGARIALLNKEKRLEAQDLAQQTLYVETAIDPHFQEEFVNAIHLPNAVDAFPHLAGVLPVAQAGNGVAENGRSARKRRRARKR